ncbi:MAG: hypothetical protein KJ067_14195 [Vicinamibacteria bacterium]|nr:hypothetical protein [Vicinamibacteria bacterium]
MPRDSRVYLEDIVTSAERVASYVEGHSRKSFVAGSKTVRVRRDAVSRARGRALCAVRMVHVR